MSAKIAAGIASAAILALVAALWRAFWRFANALVWLCDNMQALADAVRLVAKGRGAHEVGRRLDVMTDALEDSRYPERGMVPQERQRRKDQTLAIEDREGVEHVRQIRALIRNGTKHRNGEA